MPDETWQLDHDGWSERWQRSGGAFARVDVGSRRFRIDRDDLTALRPRRAGNCDVCRDALPQAFSYCFQCGAELHDVSGPAERCQDAPNAGSAAQAGLPPLTLADSPGRPREFELPPGRRFAFAVAGAPARLFAIDRDGGGIHQFDRRQQTWTRLFGVAADGLPDQSWSAAADDAGIVIPTLDRLTVLDLTQGPLPQLLAFPYQPGDACVGGACIMQGEALVPVMRAGRLHIARRRMLRGADWSFGPVRDAPPRPDPRASPQTGCLSAPVVTDTSVSWSGEAGFVFAGFGESNALEAPRWRTWSDGFRPLLAHRPFVEADGGVWQFGRLPAGGGGGNVFGFERIAGSASQASREPLRASVLASGVLACRLLTLRAKPWIENNPYNRELPGRDDDFLVPVLALDGERAVLLTATGRDRLAEFASADAEGIETPLPAGLRFCDGHALHDLALPLDLRSLTQVAAFVFENHLHVYDASQNQCWRWPLRPAA